MIKAQSCAKWDLHTAEQLLIDLGIVPDAYHFEFILTLREACLNNNSKEHINDFLQNYSCIFHVPISKENLQKICGLSHTHMTNGSISSPILKFPVNGRAACRIRHF